jgi:hypothetical protein
MKGCSTGLHHAKKRKVRVITAMGYEARLSVYRTEYRGDNEGIELLSLLGEWGNQYYSPPRVRLCHSGKRA